MKTVICLGLHKTGSTSLQHYLLANQVNLARNGVLFPPVHAQGVARFLGEALGRFDPQARAARLNEYMGHNALAHRLIADALADSPLPKGHAPMPEGAEVLEAVADMAQQLAAQALVFCSEDLATVGVKAPQSTEMFGRHFGAGPVGLFAVIRRPDDALSSWQSQMLKFRRPFPSLEESGVGPWLRSVHVDYRAALTPWVERFPKAERFFLPYGEVRKNGGAIAAFEQAFPDIARHAPCKTKDANSSLPYAMIEVARIAMWHLDLRKAVELRGYLSRAARRLEVPRNEDVDLLGAVARAELAASFEGCHGWLGDVTGRKPFFEDIDEIRRARLFDGRSATAEIMPELIADSQMHLTDPDLRAFLDRLHRQGV